MSTTQTTSPPDMVYLGARVPSALIQEVKGLAELDDRSVSSIVRVALNEYLVGRSRYDGGQLERNHRAGAQGEISDDENAELTRHADRLEAELVAELGLGEGA